MSLSGSLPVIKPAFSADFVNTERVDHRLTFTRASTATFYDGVTTVKAEENLLLRSQEFDVTSVWTQNTSPVTANTEEAPDKTTTADTIITSVNDGNGFLRQNFTAVSGVPYVLSVFLKYKDSQWVRLRIVTAVSGNPSAFFDIQNGVVGNTGSGLSASIQSVGNGWYRCILAFTPTAGGDFRLAQANGDTDASQTINAGFYAWGAQAEQRSAVTAYTATTTQTITNYIPALRTAAAGVGRIAHDPITRETLGLHMESAGTNLLTYSEQFDNAAWTKNNSTITANTIIAPDGTLTGDKLNSNSGVLGSLTRSATTANSVITIYVKFAGSQYCLLGTAAAKVVVDLISGTLSKTSDAFNTYSITNAGNGWYRVSIANITATSYQIQIESSSTSTGISLNGNGWDGIYIWGAQLETGSLATSYIPTVASQVTRAADTCTLAAPQFDALVRQGEGALYAEVVPTYVNVSNYFFGIAHILRGFENAISIRNEQNYKVNIRTNNVEQADITLSTFAAAPNGVVFKAIAGYQANNFAATSQGLAVKTDTSGEVPITTRINIGPMIDVAVSYPQYTIFIRKVAYYPTRLANLNLEALTL